MARNTVCSLSIHAIERIFDPAPVRGFEIPGHDRDALDEAGVHALLHDDPFMPVAVTDALDVIGLDEARLVLDELAYAEWVSAQEDDAIDPTQADRAAAKIAALG